VTRAGTIALLALLAACEKRGGAPAAGEGGGERPPGRFDTVEAKARKAVTLEELCDVRGAPGAGAKLALPPLVGGSAPPAGTWRWINLWATWCAPCVEEMPTLVRWRAALAEAGTPLELAFVSVDEDAAALAGFRAAHPELPAGPRLADPAGLPALLAAVGIDAAAPIPVHIVVGPDDRVRCVRAGALREADLEAAKGLLR
jgi:thiol-disulfide isomerase/thioredoxin